MRDVANSSSLVRRFKPTRHRPFARTVGSEFVLHARAITYNEGSPPAHAQKSKVQIWDKPSRSLSRRSCARGHGRLERRPTRRRRRLLRARRGVDVMSLPPDTKRVTKRWHVVPTDDETPARAKAAAELEARLRKEVADFDSWAWCRPRRPRSRSRRRRGHAHVDCPWRHGATPRLTGGPRRRDAGDFACRRRRRRRHRPRRRRHRSPSPPHSGAGTTCRHPTSRRAQVRRGRRGPPALFDRSRRRRARRGGPPIFM